MYSVYNNVSAKMGKKEKKWFQISIRKVKEKRKSKLNERRQRTNESYCDTKHGAKSEWSKEQNKKSRCSLVLMQMRAQTLNRSFKYLPVSSLLFSLVRNSVRGLSLSLNLNIIPQLFQYYSFRTKNHSADLANVW